MTIFLTDCDFRLILPTLLWESLRKLWTTTLNTLVMNKIFTTKKVRYLHGNTHIELLTLALEALFTHKI